MTTLEIKGDWNITKGKLKQKWANLTDNGLRYTEGQQELCLAGKQVGQLLVLPHFVFDQSERRFLPASKLGQKCPHPSPISYVKMLMLTDAVAKT